MQADTGSQHQDAIDGNSPKNLTAAQPNRSSTISQAGKDYDLGSTRLQVDTSETTGQNGELIRRMEVSGLYEDQISGIGRYMEKIIEGIWKGVFHEGDGTIYELTTDITPIRKSVLRAEQDPDIVFKPGVCSKGIACASNISGTLLIQNFRYLTAHPDILGHEFGHLLGFTEHFGEGTDNIMRPDGNGSVEVENLRLLWEKHHP